jgi:addiction module RelE/StbE family toxin
MAFKARSAESFKEAYKDLTKKDNELKLRLRKKMEQILESPKNHDVKKYGLKGIYGVHVNPYVILYRIIGDDTVEFLHVDHHDKVYKFRI